MFEDFKSAKKVFDDEVSKEKKIIIESQDMIEAKKRIEQIDKKIIHTDEVINDGLKTCGELGFNESVKGFAYVALLDHDIGRFSQMRRTGSYRDLDLEEMTGIKNHGVLGKMILEEKISDQLPNLSSYHEPIKQIVEDHVSKINEYKELLILSSNLLKNYTMEELLSSNNSKDIISSMTQIVQDVDRLDIYHQILDGRWTPVKVEDDIKSEVFEKFYNGEYLNMADLKQQNLWNPNVGELVRLGFINQIKLLSVAKVIKEENIIMRLKEIRQNPKALDAFDFANEQLNEMIENSTDGVTVGKIVRLTRK